MLPVRHGMLPVRHGMLPVRHGMLPVRHGILPSFTNNLTLKRIASIILVSILSEDFTSLVMRVLEAGAHFSWLFYHCPFCNA
jgi:hypothetical protein